jgi:signal transduction histidine kinase
MEKSHVTGYLTQPATAAHEDERSSPWSLQEWEFGVVFIALYLVAERLSFIEPWQSTGITLWNPRVALVIGVVLLRGLRAAPALGLAMVLAEGLVRVDPTSVPLILMCAGASAVGYVLAGLALARQLASRGRIRSLRDFAWMLGIMTMSTLLVGALYVGAHVASGALEWAAYPEGLLRQWIGDMGGAITFLPLMLVLSDRRGRLKLLDSLPRWETLLQFSVVAGTLLLIYVFLPVDRVKYFFLLFLPLVWIAARQGFAGAAAALAFIQVGLMLVVVVGDHSGDVLLQFEARMLALCVTGLLLGVVVDERERAQERLRQSLRLAAAGEMAAALAHEVNQPLTALVTYGRACEHMLAQGAVDTGQLAQTVGKLTEQAQRVGAIVKRLRDFLRSGSMNLERVAAGDFLAAIRASFAAQAAADRVTLHLKVAPDLPRVMVDRLELEIVVRNLVGNALDAIRLAQTKRREVTLEAIRQDGAVRISVIDSGPGIPPEMRDRLFTPFSTSKSHGMGLGLAISRAIVTAHGGRLWAEPTAYGSFHLTLPTVTGDADDIER